MKKLIGLLTLTLAISANAEVDFCKSFPDDIGGKPYKVLRKGNVLTEENWDKIDVISDFDYDDCKDAVAQDLTKVNGKFYWVFYTNEDRCDGGNSFGSIYTYNLKTPVAHIYDSFVYCDTKN